MGKILDGFIDSARGMRLVSLHTGLHHSQPAAGFARVPDEIGGLFQVVENSVAVGNLEFAERV